MSFLTTLASAFKGGGGSRAPLARSFTSPWAHAFDPGGARQPFDYTNAARRSFLENPVAQRAVRLVAEGA
ncbi:MAG: phage portal protein, partial [Verrucomicrobiaceae bacterium]